MTLNRYLLLVELMRKSGERQYVRPVGLRAMIEIIGAAAEYPEKLVVATFQRTEIWQVTKVPFSD